MPIFASRSTDRRSRAVRRLYGAIVAQSREPYFYERLGVPDTPDGRYDVLALHTILVLRRMRGDAAIAAATGQALFDLMFIDMDENLREMGVGDLAVGKRIKALVQGFYGRLAAYDAAIGNQDRAALAGALRRNLYRKATPSDDEVAFVADYVLRQATALAGQDGTRIADGDIAFASVSTGDQRTHDTLHR